MHPRHRLAGWTLALTMLAGVAAPLARASEKDEFPVPTSSRFT